MNSQLLTPTQGRLASWSVHGRRRTRGSASLPALSGLVDGPVDFPGLMRLSEFLSACEFQASIRAVQISLLKSKIHQALVTAANVNSEGSLSISADLAELVELEEYERILVGNIANGERFETYLIYGLRGVGAIELNGAVARLGKPGDRLTIMSFGLFHPEEARTHQPKVIVLGETNRIFRQK